jgi:hypothetical protein
MLGNSIYRRFLCRSIRIGARNELKSPKKFWNDHRAGIALTGSSQQLSPLPDAGG